MLMKRNSFREIAFAMIFSFFFVVFEIDEQFSRVTQ